MLSKSGSKYQGFWFEGVKHGIGKSISATGEVTYQVYNKDRHITDLTIEEALTINAGYEPLPRQMQDYYTWFKSGDPIFQRLDYDLNKQVDFNFIET